jgi:hypothetical protein
MTVFEDLIGELKDEKLLEDTIFDNCSGSSGKDKREPDASEDGENGTSSPIAGDAEIEIEEISDGESDDPMSVQPLSKREFFRKRAMEEVSSLQMVEHVLTGVELEQLKVSPSGYDDLNAKKALHRFLQVSDDLDSEEHYEAEFELRQETEQWAAALSARDETIKVSHIRRFCENSKPALSSQALLSLARFYRNAPLSENVRGKFDYVMTRLFLRESEDHKRKLLFSPSEMIAHIRTLYENWSSLSLYSMEENPSEVRAQLGLFFAFAAEAEAAKSLDELVSGNLFERIREAKESMGDMFYVPEVLAAAIDCNCRIGNRFIDLVRSERSVSSVENIETKYGYSFDKIVSNATGKTIEVIELLKSANDHASKINENEAGSSAGRTLQEPARTKPAQPASTRAMILGVNKWLVAATIAVSVISGGMYFWAEQYESQQTISSVAKQISLDNSGLGDYLRTARGTKETFYGVTLPNWDDLPESQRKKALETAREFSSGLGYKKVQFVNIKGRTVGFASKDRVEVFAQ